MKNFILLCVICQCHLLTAAATEMTEPQTGDVRVSLEDYIRLIEAASDPEQQVPVAYAIGQAAIDIRLQEQAERTTAVIRLQTTLEVLGDQWTSVPLLPVGTAVTKVTVNGQEVSLAQQAEWLVWNTRQSGSHVLVLEYAVDARRSDQGQVVPVPVPRASSSQLQLTHSTAPLDVAVVPATNIRTRTTGSQHQLSAQIPGTSALLLSWRVPDLSGYVVSRASYHGDLSDEAMILKATFAVDVLGGEPLLLPVLANSVVLQDVLLDGQPTTVLNQDGHFQVRLPGRGAYQVQAEFQVPVQQQSGPPQVVIPTPQVAISGFTLTLPGRQDVSVMPHTKVSSQQTDEQTVARGFVPLTDEVVISWIDAVPQDQVTEWRANANLYHAFWAEEGVLYGRGVLDYTITQGETSVLSFTLPQASQVNHISSQEALITDWQERTTETGKTITVYLDRKVSGAFKLQLTYEQLLGHKPADSAAIDVPLIRALDMHRQRGIVALLVGQELTLKPVKEQGVTRVGENQLPGFFRDQLNQVIAHTFKYAIEMPELAVITMTPERQQGKYDAQVDTLISLGEVTLRGSAGIRLDVKSGGLRALDLHLPDGVNVLNVAGPSIRQHRVLEESGGQRIAVEFTQEMIGQFQLEVNYEHILTDQQSAVAVPTITVNGAEVQHGRIAVEALTAVEIQATEAVHLSTLAINELPQQLVLKTTNPILLSYKYVNTDQPHRLSLSMTRHEELAVQVAAIEQARYQTLITDDGLAVTTARFDVRNSRQQFLRLGLPAGSEVWSVFVNGQPEKPARASTQAQQLTQDILIKMLNATSGFPVEVIYATPIKPLGFLGRLEASLPQPDMVVTQTSWDLYLPVGPVYHDIDTNLQITAQQQAVTGQLLNEAVMQDQRQQPLRLTVPAQGLRFSFEKLYANQAGGDAYVHIGYAAAEASRLGLLVSVFSVVLIWAAVFALHSGRWGPTVVVSLLLTGVLGLVASLGLMPTSATPALMLILVGGLLFVLRLIWPRLRPGE